MRSRLAIALVIIIACASNETSPAGAVGKPIDLRSRITKPEVAARAPADDAATKQEFPVDVQGVKAKLVWRTFEDSGTKYILSARWEVVTPAKGITLEPLGTLNPENASSPASPVQAEIMRVRWHDNTGACSKRYGEMSVKIDASGNATVI
jgi:hypothetical protein